MRPTGRAAATQLDIVEGTREEAKIEHDIEFMARIKTVETFTLGKEFTK